MNIYVQLRVVEEIKCLKYCPSNQIPPLNLL